ncbi:hypothetical protein L1D61_06645 [Vibrio mediterranei]|nr:hypothetical protein [Vibrio mediterranei]
MGKWKAKKLDKWKQTRQHGRSQYVLKTTLIAGGSVLLGKTIGFVIFDRVRTWSEFWYDFGLSAVALLVLGIILGFVSWHFTEFWYERENNGQKRT